LADSGEGEADAAERRELLAGKKWAAAGLSIPPIKNNSEQREATVFLGESAVSFSRVGAGLSGAREDFAEAQAAGRGDGGMAGLQGAANF
jgi:hypothetical protein